MFPPKQPCTVRPAPRTQGHVEPHALTEVWATSAHISWSPSMRVILSQGGLDQVAGTFGPYAPP